MITADKPYRKRPKMLGVHLTEEEMELIRRAAKDKERTLSGWARRILLRVAKRQLEKEAE